MTLEEELASLREQVRASADEVAKARTDAELCAAEWTKEIEHSNGLREIALSERLRAEKAEADLASARKALERIHHGREVIRDGHTEMVDWEPGKASEIAGQALSTIGEEGEGLPGPRSDDLSIMRGEAEPRFRCKARYSSLPDPQDCDWPQCGCDPVATRVLESIEESGLRIVPEYPRLVELQRLAFNLNVETTVDAQEAWALCLDALHPQYDANAPGGR